MRRRPAPLALSALAMAMCAVVAHAQDAGSQTQPGWASALESGVANLSTTPGVIPQPTPADPGVVWGATLGELYTDNLKLAAPGQSKDSSFITQLEPFVKAAWGSQRFSGMVDASATGYLYTGSSRRAQVVGHLDSQGTFTVLPQHLFVDGVATYSRATVNNEFPAGAGTFFLNNNSANVATASLSPYWVQDLGRAGTLIARYTRGRVVYNRRGVPNVDNGLLLGNMSNLTSNAVQVSLTSPPQQLWGWNAGYTQQWLDPDSGNSFSFATATAGVSRQVGPGTRLLADAGKENRFLPDGSVDYLGAWFWDAGVEWSNTLNSVLFKFGHRFFGRSYQLSWTHTAARLTTNVSYVEQPTDLNQQLLGQVPGQIVVTPLGLRQLPSLSERLQYLMKRFSGSATYEMPRGNLQVTLYDESRDYFLQGYGDEKVANADLGWQFQLGPFTTLTPNVGWRRYRFRDATVNYSRYAQLAFVHQIDPGNFITLRYRNDSRTAFSPVPIQHGYRVNIVFAQWTHLF